MDVTGTWDAVVVGSGPNGLAAAISLAERGWSVCVLEAQPEPGGGLQTQELTLPGFRHDLFSAVHPAGAASPVFARWPLADHGLTWVHPATPMVHVLDGGRAGALHRDLEATRASLNALTPGDGDAWAAFARPWLARFGGLRDTMLSAFPPVKGPARLLAGHGLGGTLEFARLLLAPAVTLGEELFSGDGARAWLYGSALHGDVPVDGAGSAIAACYLNLLGHAVGWPSPAGGAGALAAALVAHLRSLGGEVVCSSPVTGLELSRGRLSGVRTGDRVVRARRVLCDVSAPGLLALAGDALPDPYVRKLLRFRPGPGTLKLDWALDGPIPWTASVAGTAGTVHVAGDTGTLEHAGHRLARGKRPKRPLLLLGQQSLADPTRAPAGRHTAWAYTHLPQGDELPGGDRDKAIERMEDQVERFAPGFRDRILARHVLGPAELQARNANLVGGDVGGGSYALHQLVFRPVPSLSPYRTPLRGLYLASAATFPGGAVHGVCGRGAARAALLDARVPLR